MKWPLSLILTLLLSAFSGPADAQLQVTLLPESRLVIEGRSTINRFECRSELVEGSGALERERVRGRLQVAVEDFSCGKSRMDADFREAMKADQHPWIRFELADAQLTGRSAAANDHVHVRGQLTIAGVTREVHLEAAAEPVAGRTFRVSGSKTLQMTQFGIDPPTALAGLIKAHDRIVVRFDLLAEAE